MALGDRRTESGQLVMMISTSHSLPRGENLASVQPAGQSCDRVGRVWGTATLLLANLHLPEALGDIVFLSAFVISPCDDSSKELNEFCFWFFFFFLTTSLGQWRR